MDVNRGTVETFLRISIFICVIAFCVITLLMLFDVGGWALWTPGLIACAGVILSFGVYLNKLHSKTGAPITPDVVTPKQGGGQG